MFRLCSLLLLIACKPASDPNPPSTAPEPTVDTGLPTPSASSVQVTVTLDGAPVADAWVSVGGGMHTTTDAQGLATVELNGQDTVIASHPEARTRAVVGPPAEVTIELHRFSRTDNLDYEFQDPGVPGDPGDTSQCGHCHGSMVIDWDASPHRSAASNPVVHGVYAGVSLHGTAGDCAAAGGTWREGLEPGTGLATERCYLGSGALPDLNPGCGEMDACDGIATNTAGCADCHAPGIDGVIGGRGLLEAVGRSFDEGIHCDVCHKVESVDLTAPPGVAGALRVLRPSEPPTSLADDWATLTFGPYPDVPNPRMGAVQRDHFRDATLCAGCHQLEQQALIPGQALDASRWPDGLPVHTTYAEWLEGAYAPQSPCQSCHMPPDPRWRNSWDNDGGLEPSIATGWDRPPGSVRRHVWDGPRGTGPLLSLAASLDVEQAVVDGVLEVSVTTSNVGAGHAIPTGEPLRSLILVVQATCAGVPAPAVGGDVVPSFGGALATQDASGDWTTWPGAAVGERIRVVSSQGWRDYRGPLRFGDGSFGPEAKGMPLEAFVDEATIVAVAGDAVTLDHALAPGDRAYRVDGIGLPSDGEASRAWAGAPGFAFARVLADAEGKTQVPHHRAVDVVSDNRIRPQQAVTTVHRFAAACASPTVEARLMHRPYPVEEARLRGWDARDQEMAR